MSTFYAAKYSNGDWKSALLCLMSGGEQTTVPKEAIDMAAFYQNLGDANSDNIDGGIIHKITIIDEGPVDITETKESNFRTYPEL